MRRSLAAPMVVFTLLATACGDDGVTAPNTTTTTTSTTTTSTTTTSTTTTTTEAPAPACELAGAEAALDAVVADGRLPAGGAWSTDDDASRFTAETADPDLWAEVLGLDCGARLTQTGVAGDRLALVSWTGPRMAFVVRTDETASPIYARTSTVSLGFEAPRGEFLRDDNSLWGATLDAGETVLVGHIDFNLGVAAKTFSADAPPFGDPEINVEAERVGIEAALAAGGRNVGIAQTPEFGSEEGYVQLVSRSGQILVIDVAPTGWFDPMAPRYYTGETTITEIGGVEVRITEPAPGEGEFTVGTEIAWACLDHVWILEPTSNGTGDEMLEFVADLIGANAC